LVRLNQQRVDESLGTLRAGGAIRVGCGGVRVLYLKRLRRCRAPD
jgi:hypothetical protein